MFKWLVRRRKCASEIERYVTLIFCMITDIKNVDHLMKIYDFAEVLWRKEKREAGKEITSFSEKSL